MSGTLVRVCTMTAIVATVAAWSGVVRARQQVPSAPVFTAQQATAGKSAYARHCASCHMPDLSGNAEMPALAGTPFMATWGTRTTKELFDYISAAMPYGAQSLTVDAYKEIVAFVLQSNGAVAGDEGFSTTTIVPIKSVTSISPPARRD